MASKLSQEIAELRGLSGESAAFNHSGAYSYKKPIPEPDKGGAAAFELLEYIIERRGIVEVSLSRSLFTQRRCLLMDWVDGVPETLAKAEADTLAEAIATACRDALKAIREAGTE